MPDHFDPRGERGRRNVSVAAIVRIEERLVGAVVGEGTRHDVYVEGWLVCEGFRSTDGRLGGRRKDLWSGSGTAFETVCFIDT